MEKLQAKLLEMRRKLDDTTAAMQELGRENQSLQVRCLHKSKLCIFCITVSLNAIVLLLFQTSPLVFGVYVRKSYGIGAL